MALPSPDQKKYWPVAGILVRASMTAGSSGHHTTVPVVMVLQEKFVPPKYGRDSG